MHDVTGRWLRPADRAEWEQMNRENERAAKEAQAKTKA